MSLHAARDEIESMLADAYDVMYDPVPTEYHLQFDLRNVSMATLRRAMQHTTQLQRYLGVALYAALPCSIEQIILLLPPGSMLTVLCRSVIRTCLPQKLHARVILRVS